MKKILKALCIILCFGLIAPAAALAQVFNQNQMTISPYGGIFYSTSTSGGAKAGQIKGTTFGDTLYWTGTRWATVATSSLGLGFSTTSASYFLSQNQGAAFSTTSANYHASVGLAYSTTSTLADLTTYNKGFFFSTTSALAHLTSIDKGFFFSTTSASYFSSVGLAHSTTSVAYQLTQPVILGNATATTFFTTTFTGTNASTSALTISGVRGGLVSAGPTGVTYSTPTTTVTCAGTASCTGFIIPGSSPITITGAAVTSSKWATTSDATVIAPNGGLGIGIIVSSSSTFQRLNFATSTGSEATTTAFFATTASSSAFFANTARIGALTGGTGTFAGTLGVTGLTTLTGGFISSATSSFTTLSGVTSSSTNLTISGISSCTASAGSALQTSSAGVVSCGTIGGFEVPLTFTYPLVRTTNTISLAFGTTTNNTWSGTNAFANITFTEATGTTMSLTTASTTNAVISGIRNALLYAGANGIVAGTATNTVSCTSGVSCTAFQAIAAGAISITNTGVTSLAGTAPIFVSGSTGAVTVGSSFSTSTTNVFTGTNSFTGALTFVNATGTTLSLTTSSTTRQFISELGTPAGAFLAIAPNGQVIATSTPPSANTSKWATTTDATVITPNGSATIGIAIGAASSTILGLNSTNATNTILRIPFSASSWWDHRTLADGTLVFATGTSAFSRTFAMATSGATCIGMECLPPPLSGGLMLRDQYGTGPYLFLGGNDSGDTDWMMLRIANNDSTNNDRLSFGVTSSSSSKPTIEIMTLHPNLTIGIGSTTPWGKFSIVATSTELTRPILVIATSTTPESQIFQVGASSTIATNWARITIGTTTIPGTGYSDAFNFYVKGFINSSAGAFECDFPYGMGNLTADSGALQICGDFAFDEDGNAATGGDSSAWNMTLGGKVYLQMYTGPTAVNSALALSGDGAAVALLANGNAVNGTGAFTASSSMAFEAVVAASSTNATSSLFIVGIEAQGLGSDYAISDATVATRPGYRLVASTTAVGTTANWFIVAGDTAGANFVWRDTGVAALSAAGVIVPQRIRILVQPTGPASTISYYWIDNQLFIATTTVAASRRPLLVPKVSVGSRAAGLAKIMAVGMVRFWVDDI